MKFAEHLAAHITPEWRKQYINYEEMKARLYYVVEEAPSPESADQDYIARYFTASDEQFFSLCDRELKKINTFYSEKLAEATRKYATLVAELNTNVATHLQGKAVRKKLPARKMQELKLAFSEYYLSLILLQNYQNLNFTGFRKILKKHDKILSVDSGLKWREQNVDVSHFYTNKDIDRLISETEATVTMELEGGDRQKAMKRLRVPPLGEQKSPWTTFKVGLFSGSFIVLFIAVVLSGTSNRYQRYLFILESYYYNKSPALCLSFFVIVQLSPFVMFSFSCLFCPFTQFSYVFRLTRSDPFLLLSVMMQSKLRVLIFCGWCYVSWVFTACFFSAIFHEGNGENLLVAIRLYRGPLLLVEFLFLIGVNVYGWRSYGVNHVLIFELDPRNHLSDQDLMEIAAILGVVWTLSLLSFLFSSSLSIPPYVNPLALTFIMIVFMINPMRVFRHEARFWVLRVLGRIIAAPFFHVGFADFWLADQLNSLTSAFLDFHFVICFYLSNGNWIQPDDTSQCLDYSYPLRPLVHCLPAWFRFAQCLRRYVDTREAFPHLANAAKYSTTFFVVIFSSLRSIYKDEFESDSENVFVYLWIIASIVSSCYTYTWDIKMDWGLFDSKQGDNKFLREEIVYNSTAFYYFAIIEDLILRFAWIISFALQELGLVSGDIMTSVLAPLEVFRRFVWNFFRLENEHLNNCGKFRAVRDISVAPLDSSDAAQVIRMMDEDDGVTNRKKRKSENKKHKEPDRQMLLNNFEDSTLKSWRM